MYDPFAANFMSGEHISLIRGMCFPCLFLHKKKYQVIIALSYVRQGYTDQECVFPLLQILCKGNNITDQGYMFPLLIPSIKETSSEEYYLTYIRVY